MKVGVIDLSFVLIYKLVVLSSSLAIFMMLLPPTLAILVNSQKCLRVRPVIDQSSTDLATLA